MELQRMHEVLPVLPITTNPKFGRRNFYSCHDNRYSLEHVGESFGKGLGKKKKRINQHASVDLVSWKDQPLKSMSSSQSVTVSSYRPVSPPNALTSTFSPPHNMLSKYHIFTKGNFHKYPHCHHQSRTVPSLVRPSTQTTDWSCDHSYVTPLWVMAATQKPLVTRNSWKYSYKFK